MRNHKRNLEFQIRNDNKNEWRQNSIRWTMNNSWPSFCDHISSGVHTTESVGVMSNLVKDGRGQSCVTQSSTLMAVSLLKLQHGRDNRPIKILMARNEVSNPTILPFKGCLTVNPLIWPRLELPTMAEGQNHWSLVKGITKTITSWWWHQPPMTNIRNGPKRSDIT